MIGYMYGVRAYVYLCMCSKHACVRVYVCTMYIHTHACVCLLHVHGCTCDVIYIVHDVKFF